MLPMHTHTVAQAEKLTADLLEIDGQSYGLILVTGANQSWVQFTLLGLLGFFQHRGYSPVAHNTETDNYYFTHLPTQADTAKPLHFYGAIRDTETLLAAIESAKTHIVIAAMHVTGPQEVMSRAADMLAEHEGAPAEFEEVMQCVVEGEE